MEHILDEGFAKQKESVVRYAGFMPRLGALIIDGIVMVPLTLGLTWLNIGSWKSVELYVIATLIAIAYKPFMEAYYGATLGKMAFDLRVVNLKLEKASVLEVMMRNIFNIVPSLITIVLTVSVYRLPEFDSVSGYAEYNSMVNAGVSRLVTAGSTLLTVADIVVFFTNDQHRSLHDKIGGTSVIHKMGEYRVLSRQAEGRI